jgi:hypothetical protein
MESAGGLRHASLRNRELITENACEAAGMGQGYDAICKKCRTKFHVSEGSGMLCDAAPLRYLRQRMVVGVRSRWSCKQAT